MPRVTVLLKKKAEKIPWYVRRRVPPEEVRRWLFEQTPKHFTFIKQKEWDAFLKRRREGRLKPSRGANTILPCPNCGRFLRHFYITTKREVLEKAKEDSRVHRLVSGYVCWFPCSCTYFPGDIRQNSQVGMLEEEG